MSLTGLNDIDDEKVEVLRAMLAQQGLESVKNE